jgi:hypothetical protein
LKRAGPPSETLRNNIAQYQSLALPSKIDRAPEIAFGKSSHLCAEQLACAMPIHLERELSIDNNASERAMRPVALGRKNWLFAGSSEGGQNAAIIASFVQTCKQHGINPQIYLKDVLTRLSTGQSDFDALLPGRWVPNL